MFLIFVTPLVHPGGEKTVPICFGGESQSISVDVRIAKDRSKLPLLVVFKGTSGGSIEKSLDLIRRRILHGTYKTRIELMLT